MSDITVEDKKIYRADEMLAASSLMPCSEKDLQVLNERAEHFAMVKTEEKKINEATTYVKFRLGENEHYGIAFESVKEVMHNVIITKLPRTPDYIAGIINRRSALIAILDIGYIFHNQVSDCNKDSYIIIVSKNNLTIGILTNGIEGSDAYDVATLNPPIASELITNMNYIIGLHNGDTTIVNIESILSDKNLMKGI